MQKDSLSNSYEPDAMTENTPMSLDKTMWMQLVFTFGKKVVHSKKLIAGEHYAIDEFLRKLEQDREKALGRLKALSLTVGICNAMKATKERIVPLSLAEDYGSIFYSQVMEHAGQDDDSIVELEDGTPDEVYLDSNPACGSELDSP